MGLDMTAYRGLSKVENPVLDSDGNPSDWGTHFKSHITGEQEKHWPGRADGVEKDTVYTFAESFGFRAGSYSGYNRWRDQLAKVAGHASAAEAWASDHSGPFMELVNFSDCEGTIGPVVAAKLVKDFSAFKDAAQREDEYFFQKYCDWEKAFKMAADNGAVDFH